MKETIKIYLEILDKVLYKTFIYISYLLLICFLTFDLALIDDYLNINLINETIKKLSLEFALYSLISTPLILLIYLSLLVLRATKITKLIFVLIIMNSIFICWFMLVVVQKNII